MIVMKFGGSSLKNAERIQNVSNIIKLHLEKKPIVVLSALGSTTEDLTILGQRALKEKVDAKEIISHHKNCANELNIDIESLSPLFTELNQLLSGIHLVKELSLRTNDLLLSFGERLSVRLVEIHLKSQGLNVQFYDAFSIGMLTSNYFSKACVLSSSYKKIRDFLLPNLKKNQIPIITGFIGKSEEGEITTLGRGGSDLTASVIGSSLKVEEIQVWKDVDGILSTDPNIVKNPKVIDAVSFEEAAELAYFGAKVLHPQSILPAMEHNIAVRVKNSYDPEQPGTKIVNTIERRSSLLTAIASKKDITLVDVVSTRMLGQHGFLSKVFSIFCDLEISVDVIATSEVSLSLTLDKPIRLDELKKRLEEFSKVTIQDKRSIITLIGNVEKSTQVLKQVFSTLEKENIQVEMVSHGASKVNMSFIIENYSRKPAIIALHNAFFKGSDNA